MKKMTTEEFKKDLYRINPKIEMIGEYLGSRERLLCKCLVCGNIWNPKAQKLREGHGCPACARLIAAQKRAFTNEEFISKVKAINKSVEIIGTYKNIATKIECRCKKCGAIWKSRAGHILEGQGCPECAKERIAKSSRLTQKEFIEKVKKANLELKVVGKYTKYTDKVEVQCKRCKHIWKSLPDTIIKGHGCPKCNRTSTSYIENFIAEAFKFVVGKDEVINRNKTAIGKELDIYIPAHNFAIEYGSWFWHEKVFKKDLEKYELCKQKGIKLIIIYDSYITNSKINIENVYTYTNSLSSKNMFESLKELILSLFDIIGLSPIFTSEDWDRISNIAHIESRRISTKDFIKNASKYTNSYRIIGEYKGSTQKIKCKCKKCNQEWEMTPKEIFGGRKCPRCFGHIQWTNETFIKELKSKYPHIIPISNYVNSYTNMKFKCAECGKTWETQPHGILNGNGCPECGKENTRKANSVAVIQYSKYGKIISRFNSISEASRKTKTNDSSIFKVCNGTQKLANGFIWKYADEKYKKKNNKRKVMCLETKKTYNSIAEASKETGCNLAKICNCCKGLRKETGGYHWKYVDE